MTTDNDDVDQELLNAAQSLQSRVEEIHKIFLPEWEARASSIKTIITLSSGSIVLSNTFSSSIRLIASIGSLWRWLILISFVLLVLSLISAFIALWFHSRVYALQSNVYILQSRARRIAKDPAAINKLLDNFKKFQQKAFDSVATGDL